MFIKSQIASARRRFSCINGDCGREIRRQVTWPGNKQALLLYAMHHAKRSDWNLPLRSSVHHKVDSLKTLQSSVDSPALIVCGLLSPVGFPRQRTHST